LRNADGSWGAWQPFATEIQFTLSTANGLKTVQVQFQRASGAETSEVSDSILLFENGDFERGLAQWQVETNQLPVASITTTADGTPVNGTAALLGSMTYGCNNVPIGHAGLVQAFTVPATGGNLRFQYFMLTYDGSPADSSKFDAFEVYIQASQAMNRAYNDANHNPQNTNCTTRWRVPGAGNPRPEPNGQMTGWYEYSLDLNAYRDQTITIYFRNYSRFDNYYNTYTYLDNVRVEP
jgi:hypothetical protein